MIKVERIKNSQNLKRNILNVLFALMLVISFSLMMATPAQAATITNAATGDWNAGTTWVGGIVPTAKDEVVIVGKSTITVDVANATCLALTINKDSSISFRSGSQLTVISSLTINTGSINMVNGGTLQLTDTVTINKAGLWTPGTGTVEYNGAGAQTINDRFFTSYNNLTLAGSGAKTTTGTKVDGIISMEETATTTGTPPTYGTAATLQYKGSAAQTTGIEFITPWTGTGGVKIENASGVTLNAAKTINSSLVIGSMVTDSVFNDSGFQLASTGTLNLTSGTFKLGSAGTATTFPAFSTMNIAAGTTVEYAAGIAQIVASTPNYHNLTASGNSNKTFGGAVNVNGNLNIGAGATLDVSTSNHSLIVKGNWSNDGTFTAQNGTVTLGGLTTQAIGGSAITNFFNLTVNNVNGVTLNSNPTISGTLMLTNGKITTSANALIIATGGSISAGSNSSYVNGYLRKDFNIGSGQPVTFPIGDASAYTPVTLASMNVDTGGYLTVSMTSSDHPNIATSEIDSTMSVNRYWTLASGGGIVATYNATFNYLSGDLDGGAVASALAVRLYSSSVWSVSTVIGTPTTTATTISGEIGFGDFAIGNTRQPPGISAVGLYQTNHATSVTAMSPQTEYAVKVAVNSNSTLALLNAVKITIFYDADGIYTPGDVPSSGSAQTAAILTCTVGSTPSWSIDPNTNSTWSIVSGSCVQPTLTNTAGDFWFHFKAGKVATATTGNSKWHIYAKATGIGGAADNYQDNRTMNWYGEVTVNTPGINFGTVSLGSDFSANPKTGISVTYVCNGNYNQQVKVSAPWTGSGNSVLLNAAGNPGEGEFSLEADATATLSSAILVSTNYVTVDTGTRTSEGGNTVSTNTLWLKLGALGLQPLTYSGTVYYGISQ